MGGSSSRPKTYEQYYQSLSSTSVTDDTNLTDIDPYYVLDVRKDFEWDELTQAYRRLARVVHPDKGQPHEADVRAKMFRIATACFRKLAYEYKMREEGRPHHELKKDAQAYYASNPTQYRQTDASSSTKSFIDRFNQTFEDNKLDDSENGGGYGGMMAASSKVREDLDIPRLVTKFSHEGFNKTFDKVTLKQSNEVIVHKEPEALPMSKSMAYTELGGARPGDFGSTQEGTNSSIEFTDYMKAYTTTRLVDPRAVKQRKNYKNVDAYEADRARVMAKPESAAETAYRANKEREANKAEEARLARLRERDALAAAHHDRMNRLLMGA